MDIEEKREVLRVVNNMAATKGINLDAVVVAVSSELDDIITIKG